VEKISRKIDKEIKKIDPDVLRRFESYHWPGNVRELANAVEHAVNISSTEELLVEHLPIYFRKLGVEEPQQRSGADRIMSLSALEKEAIKKAVQFNNGNITKASKALGIGRNTLYEKMKKYGIGQ
jgi:transcriptional regulator with PAS, ATPase and Fis domain